MVVGSLWPVDSTPSATLMISFHQHRQSGGSATAEALRLAQLDMLIKPNKRYHLPYYWASFVAVGGFAEF
jgi:CHAT domain-containing protein